MKVIKQSYAFIAPPWATTILRQLETIGRTCYKSEDKITNTSAEFFVTKLIKNGHTSVLEHITITVRIITNRGVTHELVRHRIASYSQESTRWCDYGKEGEITVILPVWLDEDKVGTERLAWGRAMLNAEAAYFEMRRLGWGPEKARGVLPNDLKTEIVMTANLREWRLVFGQRCSDRAHPQMRALMRDMLTDFKAMFPIVFDDLNEKGEVVCEP